MTDAATLDRMNPPHLIVTASGAATREVPLLEELTIGRAEDNDLTLLDPKVSRHHACVSKQREQFTVADLGSANGTFVDGVRLTAPHVLRHGESILVGDVTLTYLEPGRPSATTLVTGIPTAATQAAQAQRATVTLPARRESRGPVIGLILAGAVLVLAAILVGAYVLLPGLFGRDQATPTGTTVAEITATTVATPAPIETPVATQMPTPTPVPITQTELNDRLDSARAITLRSQFENAITIYRELASRAPTDPRPEVGWAWALILDGESDMALPHAQQAVKLGPEDVDAAVALARTYVDLGNKAEALAEAERAVALGPNKAAALAVLAEALRLDGRYQEAADRADLALVQDINNADAHRARGWLYWVEDEDMGRANDDLLIALALQSELWLRRHEFGELLLGAEDYTTAIIAFQDALALRPKAVTYSKIGEAYYALGEFDPARVSLEQAVRLGADDARTYALLSNTNAKLARCDDARVYFDDALSLEPSNELALEARTVCAAGASATPVATAIVEVTPTPGPTPRPTRVLLAADLGGSIAFPVYNGETSQYDVYVSRIDGSGRRRVLDGFDQPEFSPDGRWLAVRGVKPDQRALFVVQADGSSIKKVSQNVEDNQPSWSPEGGRLLFASTKDQPGHPKALYIIDPIVLEGARIVEGQRVETGRGPVQGEDPFWMPDGRLVYKGCDYTVTPMSCGIFTISSDGGQFTQLTKNENDAAPSGSGGRIAFMSNRDGNWEIYVIRDDGTHLRRVTSNAADDGLPTWSPDGKSIAFVSNEGGPWAVWAVNADGSGRHKLFDIEGSGMDAGWLHQRISWVP